MAEAQLDGLVNDLERQPQTLEAGMVFFLHMILLDDRTGLSMCLGETTIVTEGACEPVSGVPRHIIQS